MSNIESTGAYVNIDGEQFYKISNSDSIRPFFMTIVSPSDHWLFIASNGGMTAGRKNAGSSLFPYYTDDKIIDLADITGSKTIIRFDDVSKRFWEPFSDRNVGENITRNLYKNRIGSKIIFEEIHNTHGLSFQYMWTFSEKFGFVKRACLKNTSDAHIACEILDGVQNVLPYGVDTDLQASRSTLVDAYKKCELDPASGMGIYSLSAMIVDRAEPSESLSCTTIWSSGLSRDKTLLSSTQLKAFRLGQTIEQESDVRAEKGAYFLSAKVTLNASEETTWHTVCEVNQDHAEVINLKSQIENNDSLVSELTQDIWDTTMDLKKLVAKADGLQKTNDDLSTGRHFSNVLFNIMRGGIFDDQYCIYRSDYESHIASMNKKVYDNNAQFFKDLDAELELKSFIQLVKDQGDVDLLRLTNEYLPLFFSRRHGDPSRPWNYFSIETQNKEGEKIRNYEGNWRDIFQNWEGLALTFPDYTFGFISKFLNASTIDGYNPYRIFKEGLDWEVADEHDPWSYIGYWGDHQIIYLTKLLEICEAHFPNQLSDMLTTELFVYANVPYRIKEFDAIVENPRDTIVYDYAAEQKIAEKVKEIGADGKLALHRDNSPVRASMTEKLMVALCTKLYNFIPDAGIWLNTQRPEWNDANNALVGNGVSMVTLYYLRRFICFTQQIIDADKQPTTVINRPVARMIQSLKETYEEHVPTLEKGFSDAERFEFTAAIGEIGEYFRRQAYAGFKAEKETINTAEISELLAVSLRYIDATIAQNKRQDALYHAYNVVDFKDKTVGIDHLYEMLEGQVAVLSSGIIEPQEASNILDALKSSQMFRADQYSYLLYPDRQLPFFIDKNTIPKTATSKVDLFQQLESDANTSLILVDEAGDYHFNGDINNANDVSEVLDNLSSAGYAALVDANRQEVLDIFEEIFDHKSFTGRSGTFYGYEGLGSIYWHMVSKLLLAVQENIISAYHKGASSQILGNLVQHYYEIRAGIGVNKSPQVYGAFPTDAYSHTPGNAGAQQPGMTGQVKEDLINRWAEFGVVIRDGKICFEPLLLRSAEFFAESSKFDYYNLDNELTSISLPDDALAFTYCQIPVVYQNSDAEQITVRFSHDQTEVIQGHELSSVLSNKVFSRTGEISSIQFNCINLLVK